MIVLIVFVIVFMNSSGPIAIMITIMVIATAAIASIDPSYFRCCFFDIC